MIAFEAPRFEAVLIAMPGEGSDPSVDPTRVYLLNPTEACTATVTFTRNDKVEQTTITGEHLIWQETDGVRIVPFHLSWAHDLTCYIRAVRDEQDFRVAAETFATAGLAFVTAVRGETSRTARKQMRQTGLHGLRNAVVTALSYNDINSDRVRSEGN